MQKMSIWSRVFIIAKIYYLKKSTLSFLPAIAWFVLSVFLLTIPGKKLPTKDWLSDIQFDKWVHIGMFSIMVFLFCYALYKNNAAGKNLVKFFVIIAVSCLVYGIVMEFVQKHLIPNRGFDVWDIVSDAVGCVVGYWYSGKRYIKK
jgi:VanZ family protein